MANQLLYVLTQWHPYRDACEWVLGTVYKTEGPCYRKSGAMMLFNGRGQQFGMLSGGCLEADIQRYARHVMLSGKALSSVPVLPVALAIPFGWIRRYRCN